MFFTDETLAFRIRGVFHVHAEAQTLVERKREHTALSLRIRGKSTFLCHDRQLEATDATLMYFPRGVEYTRKTTGEEELIVVHLECIGEGEMCLYKQDGCEYLIPHFEELERVYAREGYAAAMEVFYRILRLLSEQSAADAKTLGLIESALQYMRLHFCEKNFKVSALAEYVHVSEQYLRRIWNMQFGKSPMESLLDERFAHAEKMLLSGYYSVKEVALLSGFSDVKYFRSAFAKRYGMPVGVYVNCKRNHINLDEMTTKSPLQ